MVNRVRLFGEQAGVFDGLQTLETLKLHDSRHLRRIKAGSMLLPSLKSFLAQKCSIETIEKGSFAALTQLREMYVPPPRPSMFRFHCEQPPLPVHHDSPPTRHETKAALQRQLDFGVGCTVARTKLCTHSVCWVFFRSLFGNKLQQIGEGTFSVAGQTSKHARTSKYALPFAGILASKLHHVWQRFSVKKGRSSVPAHQNCELM